MGPKGGLAKGLALLMGLYYMEEVITPIITDTCTGYLRVFFEVLRSCIMSSIIGHMIRNRSIA